jgi:hypothetical protein
MKISLTHIFLLMAFIFSAHIQAQNTVTPDDIKSLIGEWTGSLTYIDYSSGKPYTMPANVAISEGKNEYQLVLSYSYPKEPKANNKEKIKISSDGAQLNNHPVMSKQKLPEGQLEITTEYSGKDNNKAALIRNIYTLGEEVFIVKKVVKFENSEAWLERNIYSFTRS